MTLTVKQEKFCQKYLETGNASEAYRLSYNAGKMKPETVNRKAKELLDNGKITARIEEFQKSARERHDVTIDSITQELEEVRLLAMRESRGASAAVSAIVAKAKIHGLFNAQVIIDDPLADLMKSIREKSVVGPPDYVKQ